MDPIQKISTSRTTLTTSTQNLQQLLDRYTRINSDYGDTSTKQLLTIATAIKNILINEKATLTPEILRTTADIFRDEYAAKHYELDTLSREILALTPYGDRLKRSLDNIATGAFLDTTYTTDFLSSICQNTISWIDKTPDGLAEFSEIHGISHEEWQKYAGDDDLLSLNEAMQLKKQTACFEYILPATIQKATGKEIAYVRPGDLLFTGKARRSDSTSELYNAYYWGNLFGLLGMKKMHVGVYLGEGRIIESGEDEEGKNTKTAGWHGVVTENIYDSIFATNIFNGLTTLGTFSDALRTTATDALLKKEGIDYDFSHMAGNDTLNCEELVTTVYKDLGLLSADQTLFKPDELYATTQPLITLPPNYDQNFTITPSLKFSAQGNYDLQQNAALDICIEPLVSFNDIIQAGLPQHLTLDLAQELHYKSGLSLTLFPTDPIGIKLEGGLLMQNLINPGWYFSGNIVYTPITHVGFFLGLETQNARNDHQQTNLALGCYVDLCSK